MNEKSQPDAFTRALFSNFIHAVIPVAGPHQRQAVTAKSQTSPDSPNTMVVQAAFFINYIRQIIIGILFFTDLPSLKKVDPFLQHICIS